jgi:hypothetical protein
MIEHESGCAPLVAVAKEKPGHCWPGCATPETRT